MKGLRNWKRLPIADFFPSGTHADFRKEMNNSIETMFLYPLRSHNWTDVKFENQRIEAFITSQANGLEEFLVFNAEDEEQSNCWGWDQLNASF